MKLRSRFPGDLIPPKSAIYLLKKIFLQQVPCYKGGTLRALSEEKHYITPA